MAALPSDEPRPVRGNPLVHRERRLAQSASSWVRSFSCEDMGVLIVCRGPIRKEAIDVFREMGIPRIGILLSEKDSIVYSRALAPELRMMDPSRVHAVPDYTGATREERVARIGDIVRICRENDYGFVFAGYGFMAEDASFVRAIEEAGLSFVGPCSGTQTAAGAKDQAKRTAIAHQVSVTPGINDATVRTLLARHPDRAALDKLAGEHRLDVPALADAKADLADLAAAVLEASYARQLDLFSIEDLAAQLQEEARKLLVENPGRRFRLKAIGGGGGKGQRIFSDAEVVPGLVREVLSEVKATGTGDNRNMLLELNVESTRHNEIQLLGNGRWCIALGGRDCSLQMHEQKLVEISITQEGLQGEIARCRAAGETRKAKALEADLGVLRKMEAEAERFGAAVELDSASTFECIVEGDRHFFMEVNTRIQVEHRVSELCYALRFANPEDRADAFVVHSLVEAMAIVARHKGRLPKPERIRREGAAIEVRVNATDRALAPSAGGVIVSWSDPVDGEIRDDQGISMKNPDTGLFMRYRLAGAYDSNIALLLATGHDRAESWNALTEVLRRTAIRGMDLATNREFLYGMMIWFGCRDPWAKPTTKFVVPYLTLVGELARETDAIDLDWILAEITRRLAAQAAPGEALVATRATLALKETLAARPLAMLLAEPHHLSAWLSRHRPDYRVEGERIAWQCNPLEVLAETYRLLALDDPEGAAAHRIWDHDHDLIERGLGFYRRLAERAGGALAWPELDRRLGDEAPAFGIDPGTWARVRAAHLGHQAGLEALALPALLGVRVGFEELRLDEDLGVVIPERLLDPAHQEAMRRVLVPPPATRADEIVAAMGGTFYAREAPGLPSFVEKGAHFGKGQPIYIIEVMKMFNKITAPFAGTIDQVLMPDDGVVVRKGQPLFKVTPDERVVEVDPAERRARLRRNSDDLLSRILPATSA
ncbi:MAG: hypothetical protein RL698_3639 [Pseudomonadota bacterium]|jgi:acetyl/propionyl-CoA carboxylase alpha subunit